MIVGRELMLLTSLARTSSSSIINPQMKLTDHWLQPTTLLSFHSGMYQCVTFMRDHVYGGSHFSDASFGTCTFNLTLHHCFSAIYKVRVSSVTWRHLVICVSIGITGLKIWISSIWCFQCWWIRTLWGNSTSMCVDIKFVLFYLWLHGYKEVWVLFIYCYSE